MCQISCLLYVHFPWLFDCFVFSCSIHLLFHFHILMALKDFCKHLCEFLYIILMQMINFKKSQSSCRAFHCAVLHNCSSKTLLMLLFGKQITDNMFGRNILKCKSSKCNTLLTHFLILKFSLVCLAATGSTAKLHIKKKVNIMSVYP